MRRRDLIATLGGVTAILPFVALGQQAPRSAPLIGALWVGDPAGPIIASLRAASRQGLQEDGYIEGQNIALAERYPKDSNEIIKAANELIGLRVDVIMAMGSQLAIAAKRVTRNLAAIASCLNFFTPVNGT